jgi:Domain of unknown function (DUF6916)
VLRAVIPESASHGFTRRTLLRTSGAAALLSLVGVEAVKPARARAASTSDAPMYLRRAGYSDLQGQSFDAGAATLQLIEVSDLERARHERALAGADDAFALVFSGPASHPLTQGVHTLRHPRLGSFDLFLVPVDQPDGNQRYEVVVDRTVKLGGSSPVPSAPAAAATPTPPAAKAHRRRLLRVRGHRLRRGAVCELTFAKDAKVVTVEVWLMRRGHPYASVTRRVHGRRSLRLRLPSRHRLRAGRYVLVTAERDRSGEVAYERRSFRLR